jgi:serine/threonine protein kinase
MTDEHLLSLQPGTIIAGRYEVVKCLGAGSMGLVYACRHRELSGHLVAVKVLFPEVAQDAVAAQRFKNEITSSYGVSHPNVVRAYEYLKDGDIVAYTMEFVGGGDLADRLGKRDSLIPISEIIRLLTQMCAGVQAIHDAGIIHRDLKPENILLTDDGNVKIADFGIARSTSHGPKLTEHGGVVGTIDYVSPEYMLNSQVDSRSDLYALGILAYEMLVGESPFRGGSVYETMTKRLKSDPKPPSALRPDCPKSLDDIVLKAMQRKPEERYQTAGEMERDLWNLQSNGVHEKSTKVTSNTRPKNKLDADDNFEVRARELSHQKGINSLNGADILEKSDVEDTITEGTEEIGTQEISNGIALLHDENSIAKGQKKIEFEQEWETPGFQNNRSIGNEDNLSYQNSTMSYDTELLQRIGTFSRAIPYSDESSVFWEYVFIFVALILGLGAGVIFIRILAVI